MRVSAVLLAALVLLPLHARAQIRAQLLATGLVAPVQFAPDPAIPGVAYIVEQQGLIRTVTSGGELPPFLDLRGAVSTGGERGLLGMAFDPDVATVRVYVNFTDPNGHTVVARFTRMPGAPLRANAASRFDLRWPGGERVIRQAFANHNGGNLVFGPDGYLYIGLGDGGSGNDPDNHAQNPQSLLGKMLRIDVAVDAGDAAGYRIPADNPFLDGSPAAALGEIWAFGLRNPWRYSFDDFGPGATGALIVGDVGQGTREEINYEPFGRGGRNYGWRLREGSIPTPGVPATPPAFGPLVTPIFEYDRTAGRAVTGGFVYRGAALGRAYQGRYFFADYVTARVWSLGLAVDPATGEAGVIDIVEHTAELGGSLGGVASFGRDGSGELYVLTFSGQLLKIVPAGASAASPPANLQASVSGSTVVLSWTSPDPGAAVPGYRLVAGSAAGRADLAAFDITSTSLTVEGVPPGSYFVRVHALAASGGASAASNEIVVTVP